MDDVSERAISRFSTNKKYELSVGIKKGCRDHRKEAIENIRIERCKKVTRFVHVKFVVALARRKYSKGKLWGKKKKYLCAHEDIRFAQ